MLRNNRWLVLLVLFVIPLRARAEESYTVKLKESKPGDTVLVSEQSSYTLRIKTVDSNGKNLPDEVDKTFYRNIFQETILEMKPEEKKPTRLKRQYQKAHLSIDDQARDLPYQGKTLFIEKKGDRYRFQIEGGQEVTGKDAEDLDGEFNEPEEHFINQDKLFLPKQPVRVGASWDLEKEPLIKVLSKTYYEAEIDAAKFTATGKLVKAYHQDGRQFGVLDFQIDAPLKSAKLENDKITFQPGAKMTVKMTLDACIDGGADSSELKLEMHLNGTGKLIDANGKQYTMTMSDSVSEQETRRDVTKK